MKILIIGKRSIIANYFKFKYEKKFEITIISFNQAKKLSKKQINNFDWILNCAFKKNKHNFKNNPDLFFLKKIKNLKIRYIMMSTSKVYGSKKISVLDEKKTCRPNSSYGKIRLKIEKKLFKSIKDRVLILRISNVLTYNPKNHKKNFNTIDQMIYSLKKYGKIFIPKKNVIKDFITLDFLTKNIFILIKKKKSGIFNIGSSIVLSLEQLAKLIIKKFGKGILVKKNNKTDNFLLSNKKLINVTKIKINKKEIINTINNFKI